MARSSFLVATSVLSIAFLSSACRTQVPENSHQAAIGPYDALPAYEEEFQMLMTSDFGGINKHTMKSNALPWKIVAASMLLYNQSNSQAPINKAQLRDIMQRFGFVFPNKIGNLRDQSKISDELPLGIVRKNIYYGGVLPVDVINIGCVACHGGSVFDHKGDVTTTSWLGLPNTSLNIDAYVEYVYRSLKFVYLSDDRIAQSLTIIKDELGASLQEVETIRWIINNVVKQRISELNATIDRSTPFSNGGPGFTNGVGSLKFQFELMAMDAIATHEAGFTSIPDLSRRGMRSSLLYDGFYSGYEGVRRNVFMRRKDVTPEGLDKLGDIVSVFAIPTMGQSVEGIITAAPEIRKVVRALNYGYHAPQFPGKVDDALAIEGQKIYEGQCASCHGTYDGPLHQLDLASFPNKFVAQSTIQTDATRWHMITDELLTRLKQDPWLDKATHPQRNEGYMAPILSGLWATAPYMHNGSVPTLFHFLHPEQRPKAFYVGGHRLNYELMGIDGVVNSNGVYDYPQDYKPWSTKVLYDTTAEGKSAVGHSQQIVGLSEAQKAALIEYLKLL